MLLIIFIFLLEMILGISIAEKQAITFDICAPTFCKCTKKSDTDSGLQFQEVDCKLKNLTSDHFEPNTLPLYIENLDVSNNFFDEIPYFFSDTLRVLVMSRNQIKSIDDQNFIRTPKLREIDLSWNKIDLISLNAFDTIKMVERLDLSYNNLKKINVMVFSYLPALNELDLSWNKHLNESNDIVEMDFFEYYGVTPALTTLRLSHCNLNELHLSRGTGLQKIYLDGNNLEKMPELPRGIKFIDFSSNPVKTLKPTFLTHLFQLETLLLEDMPILEFVEEYAFFGLPALKILSLQNSRNLKHFDVHAFGVNVIRNETDIALESINLRGTSLTTFNSSLLYAFDNLKSLNLDGAPLNCDCELKWIKSFTFDSEGQCYEPKNLRGQQISKITADEFVCPWPEWLTNIFNGLIIFGLLALCIMGISFIVLSLRRKRIHVRHIGSGSPYARITIEPTSAENHF